MNWPNTITLARLLLHILLLTLIIIDPGKYAYLGLVLYLLTSAMDKLDGVVARLTHTSTGFGRFFDGTVDKVSSLTIIATLTFLTRQFPIWFFLLSLSRDLTVEGLRQYVSLRGKLPQGSQIGKIKVGTQMITVSLGFVLFTPFYSGTAVEIINTLLSILQVVILLLGYYSLIFYSREALTKK